MNLPQPATGPIITRKEAIEQGRTRYFLGQNKPCPHGHIAERMVSGRSCTVCLKQRKKKAKPQREDRPPKKILEKRIAFCLICGKEAIKKPDSKGRIWKHDFCSFDHYNRWRANEHLRVKKDWLKFQREVWGTTELGRFDARYSRQHGRRAEILAVEKILPSLGFSEIDDLSGLSNQFFIDFIASYEGQRVLVDATIKLKSYCPEKANLARSLRMRLFIIHVSIASDDVFWLREMELEKGMVVSQVPAAFIRKLMEERMAPSEAEVLEQIKAIENT